MPNEFDELVQPGSNGNSAEGFNELIGGADASMLASPETVHNRRARRLSWNTRTLNEKLMAAARSTVNNIPIVGESLSPSNQPDVREFRENMPFSSAGTNVVGSGVPLLGQAARATQPIYRGLFGTFPRTVASTSAIGGADAASRGENPIVGAGMGGLTAAILSGAGKVTTPRSDMTRFNINREAARREFEATRAELEAATRRRKTPATSVDQLPASARERINEAGQTSIPQIPNFGELPLWAQSGIGFGTGLGLSRGHPIAGTIGAMAAPVLNMGARAGRARINSMLASAGGRRYMNNRILNDRMRTLLNSAGIALTPDELTRNSDGQPTNQQIMDFIGNAAQ